MSDEHAAELLCATRLDARPRARAHEHAARPLARRFWGGAGACAVLAAHARARNRGSADAGNFAPRKYAHLGGIAPLLGENASGEILFEEYHPFGTSSYRSFQSSEVSAKRYRYTGKERDEETGLSYHGARYYCPWLGRWTSADPAGLVDGPNLYAYVRGDPIGGSDPTGLGESAFDEAVRTGATYGPVMPPGEGAEAEVSGIYTEPPAVLTPIPGAQALPPGVGTDPALEIPDMHPPMPDMEGTMEIALTNAILWPWTMTGPDAPRVQYASPEAEQFGRGLEMLFLSAPTLLPEFAAAGTALRAAPGFFDLGVESSVAGSASRLVHLTNAGDKIAETGLLLGRNGIYATSEATAGETGVALTLRTGLANPTSGVPIPPGAAGAFTRPVPIGPITGWQRAFGTQYTAAGNLNLVTGTFVRTGVNWNQVGIYAFDAAATGTVLGSAAYVVWGDQ